MKTCRALCRGDLDTLHDYVSRQLNGEVIPMTKGQAGIEVRLVFPDAAVGKVLAVHKQLIRDADGGECHLELLPST